ncbi:carbohydrate ABC transporter permease [Nonomuraea sp. PA05]|uniref:carbohydrate ABC transporter permease n=1 Tax=Nonomuraea sp. PA05 TaxID=2604466 RepID=UPI001CA3439C|nr:sugar ABC transporter permease [Nonomuraea sp. PA05]
MISPTLLVLALVVFYPLLAVVRESMYVSGEGLDADGFVVEGERFVGLAHYAGLLGERFVNALANTTVFTLTTVVLETLLGVAMALVMHSVLRGKGLIRASILIPWAVPTAISGLMWRWVFQADGVANAIIGEKILWTTEGVQAKLAVIIADVWKTAPFVGLLVLAGLQIIPAMVYEAAKVDGASAWQTFWRITLPLVKPALVVAVLFRVLDALAMFDLPFVMIGRGKLSVETLPALVWDEATQLRYGPAAAYGIVLITYVSVIVLIFVRLLGADLLADARSRKRAA